jgi:dTDP-4-dehydrorhamnose reductase
MLGTEISLLLQKARLPFTGTDLEVDITNPAALNGFIEKLALGKPVAWIINCAAYTAVDRAEDDEAACRRLNTAGAANIAALAKSINARLIHISTDYVFNGEAAADDTGGRRPYREEDGTNPTGVYGISKREGEIAVLENNPQSYIIRTAWLYGKYGNSFVSAMLRLMNEQIEIKVVNDQRGSPTWANDLAAVILTFVKEVENGKNIPFGIYHYTNEGDITWFDFAAEIYRQGREQGCITRECVVKPCSSAEYQSKAKRPAFSLLDKSKVKTALEIKIPAWDASLKEYFKACAH